MTKEEVLKAIELVKQQEEEALNRASRRNRDLKPDIEPGQEIKIEL